MFEKTKHNLYYNGKEVVTDGEELKGKFFAIIFPEDYCYAVRRESEISSIIQDYLNINKVENLEIVIKEITV